EALGKVPQVNAWMSHLKLKKPPWVHMSLTMTAYALVVVSYFLITRGIIYDVIAEPPKVGSMTDEYRYQRPVAFLAYRVNGQCIMEALASRFLFTMGRGRSNVPNISKAQLISSSIQWTHLWFFMARVFTKVKLLGYMTG
uniref:Oligosaccharyltransferase complex subunit n=1 Tax=Loxodonta africana TaxID=9785 RepID=G3TRE1_LOXAF